MDKRKAKSRTSQLSNRNSEAIWIDDKKAFLVPILAGIATASILAVVPMNWIMAAASWFTLLCSMGYLLFLLFRKSLLLMLVAGLIICFITVFGVINVQDRRITERNKVIASPRSVTIEQKTNKTFILSVTNNNDFTIFDIHLSVCVDNKELDPSFIHINPLIIDGIKDVNPSGILYVLTNKCLAIAFGGTQGLNPRATKDYFRFTIKGKTLKSDRKIALTVYGWSKSPSVNTNADKNGNFQFAQYFTPPANPYFPEERNMTIKEIKGIKGINVREIKFEEVPNDESFIIP